MIDASSVTKSNVALRAGKRVRNPDVLQAQPGPGRARAVKLGEAIQTPAVHEGEVTPPAKNSLGREEI